jgi:hypothetical protein
LRVVAVPVKYSPWSSIEERPEGETIAIDWKGKVPGRGAYVCLDQDCLRGAIEKGGLRRVFRRALILPTVADVLAVVREGVQKRFKERLSLARRAGSVQSGETSIQESMKQDRCRLIILANDLSEGQRQKYIRNAERKGIDVIVGFSGSELGGSIRREFVGSISVEADPFASDLLRLSRQMAHVGAV